MGDFCGGLTVAGTEKLGDLSVESRSSQPRSMSRPGSDFSSVVRRPGLGSGSEGACERHTQPWAFEQTSPLRVGACRRTLVGPAISGVGLADAGALQQSQAGGQAPSFANIAQSADAPLDPSHVPTNATRAIHE